MGLLQGEAKGQIVVVNYCCRRDWKVEATEPINCFTLLCLHCLSIIYLVPSLHLLLCIYASGLLVFVSKIIFKIFLSLKIEILHDVSCIIIQSKKWFSFTI